MSTIENQTGHTEKAISQLTAEFLINYPYKSARFLETLSPKSAALMLERHQMHAIARVWSFFPINFAAAIFPFLSLAVKTRLLEFLDSHIAVNLLGHIDVTTKEQVLNKLPPSIKSDFDVLLSYPENTAARLMNNHMLSFYEDTKVHEAIRQIKNLNTNSPEIIYLLDAKRELCGEVTIGDLIKSPADFRLAQIKKSVKTALSALDSKELVIEKFEGHKCSAIPVLDSYRQLIGYIRFFDVYQSTKEDLASDIQTMVGASKDEQALSTSRFAVKKRMPWLQINLVTAFVAAAVVGLFEGLIAEITALAILLPVAAGQSGNAGAQALAVTMRGLTLREISTRQWRKVLFKELSVGFLNGVFIAITCSLCVYFWSESLGLATVMALAMVSSLTIACSAGALVPIVLKRFGLDPAQSSSIVLTTVTDIAGFMSFLGIALLLSDFLPRG